MVGRNAQSHKITLKSISQETVQIGNGLRYHFGFVTDTLHVTAHRLTSSSFLHFKRRTFVSSSTLYFKSHSLVSCSSLHFKNHRFVSSSSLHFESHRLVFSPSLHFQSQRLVSSSSLHVKGHSFSSTYFFRRQYLRTLGPPPQLRRLIR